VLGMMVEGVLMKLLGWCRGCFGISGEDGIVVALMVTADLRVVVVSSNLLKEECRCRSFNRNLPY